MRTVIFILGLIFLELLAKHWGLYQPYDETQAKFISYIVIGGIALDIFKKER